MVEVLIQDNLHLFFVMNSGCLVLTRRIDELKVDSLEDAFAAIKKVWSTVFRGYQAEGGSGGISWHLICTFLYCSYRIVCKVKLSSLAMSGGGGVFALVRYCVIIVEVTLKDLNVLQKGFIRTSTISRLQHMLNIVF